MCIYPEQDRQLESRMREIRTSGAEGGGALTGSPYLYPLRYELPAAIFFCATTRIE
jgi:hypothetical protein